MKILLHVVTHFGTWQITDNICYLIPKSCGFCTPVLTLNPERSKYTLHARYPILQAVNIISKLNYLQKYIYLITEFMPYLAPARLISKHLPSSGKSHRLSMPHLLPGAPSSWQAVEAGGRGNIGVSHLKTGHPGGRRPCMTAFKHVIDGIRITGEYGFDRAVAAVADPAGQTKPLCLLTGPAAVPHALHSPGYDYVNGFDIICHGAVLPEIGVIRTP